MFVKDSSRREFLKLGSLFFLFILNSCSKISTKVRIALQSSFYPDSFKKIIPKDWQKENINFGKILSEQDKNVIKKSNFTLINDGWINKINFNEFQKIDQNLLLEMLDKRSRLFLSSFAENQRKKLFPIGVVPYAIIIKNNKELINSARESWNFLLSEKLNKRIIFPRSSRVVISIAKRIKEYNSLAKLKNQAMLFDDQNSLNWLINSDALVAIVPYSLSLEYVKIDTRLSVVFPEQGVPLMWHFILNNSNSNNEILIRLIKSLSSQINAEKLVRQGWYLPFKNKNLTSIYSHEILEIPGPSKRCWDNTWSFPPLTNEEKIKLEEYWTKLTP